MIPISKKQERVSFLETLVGPFDQMLLSERLIALSMKLAPVRTTSAKMHQVLPLLFFLQLHSNKYLEFLRTLDFCYGAVIETFNTQCFSPKFPEKFDGEHRTKQHF